MTRNTWTFRCPLLHELSHLRWSSIQSWDRQAFACQPHGKERDSGWADGLLIEVSSNPEEAWSDGAQSLTIPEFGDLMEG